MAGHVLELHGCTPEPLGNYLKGLGVFRLIAEQADPQARAWWKDGFLRVAQCEWSPAEAASAESQCVEWLLKKCRFTPLVAPWQTGTGYLPRGKREAGGVALQKLLESDHPGAALFRDAFRDFAATLGVELRQQRSQWRQVVANVGQDRSDADLLRLLRNRIRAPSSLKWLDAVGQSASRSRESDALWWFPILASGGGEASGQYVVNHQQRLQSVLHDNVEQSGRPRLHAALFGSNAVGTLEGNSMGAMYYPSLMKVPNAGQGFLPSPQRRVNPWDFILLLEGCLVWSMAVTRRSKVTAERASFPFYCRSSFGGSMTIGPREVEGAEKAIARGELWCPTWQAPSRLTEVQRIFGEGRIQVGEVDCSRALDFAMAMTRFGTERGIHAFHRYSLLERSGSGRQTTLLAVSNGCFVPHRGVSGSLLKDLRDFAEATATNLADNGQQPRRLMLARIGFERAWFGATSSASAPNESTCESLVALLVAAGRLQQELGTNSAKPGIVKIKRGEQTVETSIAPVRDLRPDWTRILEAFDRSPECRIARAIGGITSWGESSSEGRPVPAVEAIRANLLPVQRRGRTWAWDDTSRSAVWSRGASLDANLAAVLRRRMIDAERGAREDLPLWSSYGAGFEDLLAYWNGEVDEARLTDLLHGLALVDTGTWNESNIDDRQRRDSPTPDLQTGAVWFDAGDEAHTTFGTVDWNGRSLLSENSLRAAFELPRIYHLLKLCFVGGRLPHRPVEGRTSSRTADEPFPPSCLDVVRLLQAGRLSDAAQLAARRLRAKGYPAVLRDGDLQRLNVGLDQCRRLAAMLLIPLRQPGVCAALAISPQMNP